MATNQTLKEVYTFARANLNDVGKSFWTDAKLLPHAQQAYRWMYLVISRYIKSGFEKLTDGIATVAGDTTIGGTIGSNQPADLFTPIQVDFRKNTSEEWVELARVDRLPSRELSENQTDRILEWEWRNRLIYVSKSTEAGLVRIRYLGIPTMVRAENDPILMDNVVEALADYTAYKAYSSRGQHNQAKIQLGDEEEGTGARGMLSEVVNILVQNNQLVPRVGRSFSGHYGRGGSAHHH